VKKLEQRVANKKRAAESVEPTTPDPAAKKRKLHWNWHWLSRVHKQSIVYSSESSNLPMWACLTCAVELLKVKEAPRTLYNWFLVAIVFLH